MDELADVELDVEKEMDSRRRGSRRAEGSLETIKDGPEDDEDDEGEEEEGKEGEKGEESNLEVSSSSEVNIITTGGDAPTQSANFRTKFDLSIDTGGKSLARIVSAYNVKGDLPKDKLAKRKVILDELLSTEE